MLIAIVRVVICFVLAVKVLALFSSEVLALKGRIKLGGGLELSNTAVKVLALLSSKVLAPGCPTGSIKRSWHSQCARGRGPNRPKVS
jgi:hypothetical protein